MSVEQLHLKAFLLNQENSVNLINLTYNDRKDNNKTITQGPLGQAGPADLKGLQGFQDI